MYALNAEDLERMGMAGIGLTVSSQRAAMRAGEELSGIGIAASGAYLMIWLGFVGRLLEARSPETVSECVQRLNEDWQRRVRHDVRLWMATLLETSDRLGSLAAAQPVNPIVPLRRRANG